MTESPAVPMSPARFRACIAACGWTLNGLASMLECTPPLVHRWARGEGTIPADVAAWLERRAAAALADPPPKRGSWARHRNWRAGEPEAPRAA